MYLDNAWEKMDTSERAALIEQISPIGGKYPASDATTEVVSRNPPFYKEMALVRLKDPEWDPSNLFIYHLRSSSGDLYWLNGTSPPIHAVNANFGLHLTQDNVLDYLRFFCFFVRGDEGPFLIFDNLDEPYMPRGFTEETRSKIEKLTRPAASFGRDKEGNYLCTGLVYYSNTIFFADFKVQPDGMIEMVDDEPIIADLPLKIDAPIS